MKGKCLGIIALLLLVIAAGAYKFLLQGAAEPAEDGRKAIRLDAGERAFVLAEMRTFLESAQQVLDGALANDMARVAAAARRSGMAAQGSVPGTLVGKLPMAFKQLGRDTHTRFDQLALDAEELGDGNHSLGQLAELMQNCTACHAAYRFAVPAE